MQVYLGGFWFTGMSRFQRLAKVAKLVIHSNANVEFHSIMTVKMAGIEQQCF